MCRRFIISRLSKMSSSKSALSFATAKSPRTKPTNKMAHNTASLRPKTKNASRCIDQRDYSMRFFNFETKKPRIIGAFLLVEHIRRKANHCNCFAVVALIIIIVPAIIIIIIKIIIEVIRTIVRSYSILAAPAIIVSTII